MKTLTLQQMRDAGFTEVQCYTALIERIEGSINEWRLLAHEAHQRGDETAAWESSAQIKDLERKRGTMRKPVLCNNEVRHGGPDATKTQAG